MNALCVLAIDTVSEMCSVALSLQGKLLERQSLAPNQHASIILDMVNELLAEGRVSLSSLDAIVCDVGPGSFTGIRIGIGVAQGLAYGANLPLIAVDSLSSLAYGVKNQNENDILAAMDARMGQIYWALFPSGVKRHAHHEQLHLSNPEHVALNGNNKNVYGVGSGWDTYASIITKTIDVERFAANCFPLACNGLQLGLECPKSNWLSAGSLMPIYLRNQVAKVSTKHQNYG